MKQRVAFARAEITAYERGMGLLGWGQPENVAEGVAEPLFARAMVVEDERGARAAYVCADLCFVSVGLREEVLARAAARGLGIGPHGLMLSATHTHSGPSGFSHAFFYDLAGPGFAPRVFETLAEGITSALAEAVSRLAPARLSLATTRIPGSEPVAFNRSVSAFWRNPEVRGAPSPDRAVDRTLTALVARDARGRPIGALSLFALHATSIHGDGRALHGDHKGLAAVALERWARDHGAGSDFVAIFGQGAAGDVTPNHRFDPRRGVTVGRFDDDRDSAAYVADVQARATASLLEMEGEPLDGPVGGAIVHVDFGPGRLGVAMAEGTAEGPGPLGPFRALSRLAHRARARAADPKLLLLDVGPARRARLFGTIDPLALPIADPVFVHARRAREAGGGVDEHAWIPNVLPLGILRIGPLAIVGLPNEPTTIAGLRIRRALSPSLARHGVRRVHVQGYANDYAGYLTTPEEYDVQRYEGAYTLFGRGSLAAFTRALSGLARELDVPRDPGPIPICTPRELAARRGAGWSERD